METAPPIDAAIATGQREDIALPKKVPVAWIYLTAWMTRDQTVQFRNDIYDQDQTASGSHRRRSGVLQPGRQSSADGASGAGKTLRRLGEFR